MGRSGYSDDLDDMWALIRWRGAVTSAIRGKRGQAFLQEMLTALDSLPAHRLIAEELERDGEVCALGSVGKLRGLDMKDIDPEDRLAVSKAFGISDALAAEIMYVNDDDYGWRDLTPEMRFETVRRWVVRHLAKGEIANAK